MTPLSTRVAGATGPDRALDLALATSLVPDVLVLRQRDDDNGADPYTHWEYTGKIDDALALANRLLNDTPDAPEYPLEISISSVGHSKLGPWHCRIWCGLESDGEPSYGPTAPLAILAALLSALSSSQDSPI